MDYRAEERLISLLHSCGLGKGSIAVNSAVSIQDAIIAAILEMRPVVLLLGQDGWSSPGQADDVLKVALQRAGRHGDIERGWPGLLTAEALSDNFYEWLAESWDRLPRPDWLQRVAKLPWSAIFTSSLNPSLKRDFEWTNRDPQIVLTADEVPVAARSTGRTPIYHLFGRAGISDSLASPPRNRADLRNRLHLQTIAMLNRIPETATALGLFIIDGYDASRDWLPIDPLLSIIEQMPASRVMWCGWKATSSDNQDLQAAIQSGRLITSESRLATIIGELESRGRLDDIALQTARELGAVSFAEAKSFRPSAELRIRVEAVAAIVDDSWIEFLPPLGADAQYASFREFHGDAAGPRALANGVRYNFAIKRDFESDLAQQIATAIEDHARFPEPIVVHGQSGTGKTIALARLATDVRNARKAAVLYSTGRIPNSADVEQFCEGAEQNGAAATLLICDSNAPIARYRDLATGLRSRGRKIVLAGTTYRQVDSAAPLPRNFIEARDSLSDDERQQLASLLSRFGDTVNTTQIGADKSVLATLYRVLPASRYRLAAGLSNEARAAETEIRARGGRTRPVAPRTQIAEQLMAAGLMAHDESILSERIDDALASANDSAGRLIDLVMAAGRLNCPVPVNLLMRALSSGQGALDLTTIASVFRGLDLFRWQQSSQEGEELLISPRLTLEAELICRRRLGGAASEAVQLIKLVRSVRLSWDPAGSERRFLLDLIQRLGRDGPLRNRYRESYLAVARALTDLRRSTGTNDPSLLLQEAVLRRSAIREEAVADDERFTVLEEAREAVQAGVDKLAGQTGRGARYAMANLAVERAAIYGFLATYRAKQEAPNQEVWSAYLAARTAARSAVSASGTYFPLDISLWVPADLISSGAVSESQKLELAADLYSVLDQIDPESLPSEQLENFNRRRFKLGEQLQLPALSEDAFKALETDGSTAGYYLKARSLGPTFVADSREVYAPAEREKAKAAAAFLKTHRQRIESDSRCLRYLFQCDWISATGLEPLRGERAPIPHDERSRRELLQLIRLLNAAIEPVRDYGTSYLEAVLSWIDDDEQTAQRIWRDLARDSDYVDPRRVIRRHLITDANGQPMLFSGRIEAEAEPGRFTVRVDRLGRRVQLLARDFSSMSLSYGRTIPSFAIAFNYIGPIADPTQKRSGRQ